MCVCVCVCVLEIDIRRAIHTHVQFEWIMAKTERWRIITERVNNEAQLCVLEVF